MSHVETTAAKINAASCPEDLFGDAAGVHDAYRALARDVHPDHAAKLPKVFALATAAFKRLNELKAQADQKLADNTYGDRKPPAPPRQTLIKVAGDTLELGALLRAGDIADVYAGKLTKADQQVVVKVARAARDNDLIRSERETIAKLEPLKPKGRRYFAESTKAVLDVGGRSGNVLVRYPEHIPLDQIRKLGEGMLDFRDMVWMLRRLLEGLGHLHRQGLVHANLIPPNLLFHPKTHGLRIVDWCNAVPTGKPGKAKSAGWEYPPELLLKAPLTPATDIYQAVSSARWVLGPRAAGAPAPLLRFLSGCLLERPSLRPTDAWALHEELGELLQRLVGPPKYKQLSILAGPSFT